MSKRDPFFSILTPIWNRADYIRRVYEGLKQQTLQDFHWIIADDGSNDFLDSELDFIIKDTSFPISIVKSSLHIGKVKMDNEAIKLAKGTLCLWCDSDDVLTPDAIETLKNTWESIPKTKKKDYVGLSALASSNLGTRQSPFDTQGYTDVTWNDLYGIHAPTKGPQDMVWVAKTCYLKNNPFPEVDMVIPEGIIWTEIGDKMSRLVPKVVKIVEYKAKNSISHSGLMSYNRGRAYATSIMYKNLKHYHSSNLKKYRQMINFIRFAIHGDIDINKTRKLWGSNSSHFFLFLALPLAILFCLSDRMQKKVVKSHLEFELAKNKTVMQVLKYRGQF